MVAESTEAVASRVAERRPDRIDMGLSLPLCKGKKYANRNSS
jgi:hypothetical protein